MLNDTVFLESMDAHLEKYVLFLYYQNKILRYSDKEKYPENMCYWPVQVWRQRHAKTFNLQYKKNSSTRFSRNGYIAQMLPALMMTHALRTAFDIQGGEGQIENADESMCYSFNSSDRSWTI